MNMPNYSKLFGNIGDIMSKLPAGSKAAQEAIAAEMAARKAAQEAAYAPHTLPTDKGAEELEKAKKTLGKADGGGIGAYKDLYSDITSLSANYGVTPLEGVDLSAIANITQGASPALIKKLLYNIELAHKMGASFDEKGLAELYANLTDDGSARLGYDPKSKSVNLSYNASFAEGGVVSLDDIINEALQRQVPKMGKGGSIKAAGKKLVSLIDDVAKEQKAAIEAGDTATAVAKQMELKEAIKSTVNSPALPRAKPLTDRQIQDFAERMAPQITGELTRAGSGAKTVAGKTQQQFQREKTLPVDRKVLKGKKDPMAPLPEMTLEEQMGGVLLGLPGDPTLARMKLSGIGDVAFEKPVTLHGGPRYGDDEKLWASNIAGASNLVGAGRRASEQYGGAPVYASFMKMPDGFGFANHYLESLMQYTRPDQLPAATRLALENDIRKGFVKGKNKYEFPDFVGFDDLGQVSEQALADSNLRKHLADRLEKSKIYGLRPAGDVQFAVTHPELTNIETGAGGFTIGELPLNDPFTASAHPTYTHDIPGKVLGQTRYPTPYDLLYRDMLEMVKKNPAIADDPFNTTKLLGARQQIDEQLVNEINEYQERLRRMIGKKDGGLAEGGVPEKRDVSQLFPLKYPANANLHKGRTGVWTDTNDVFTGAMSGLFNTLAGGLRGRVIGTAGIPGDIIEGMSDLEGALPKMERKPKGQTFPQTYKAPPAFKLPTMEDLDTMLPSAGDSQEAKIAQELGQFMPLTGEELAPAGRALVSTVKKAAPTAAEMALDIAGKYGVDPRMNIIKPEGGIWDAASQNKLAEHLDKLKSYPKAKENLKTLHETYTEDEINAIPNLNTKISQIQKESALNDWIDSNLTNYVKNKMATPTDPVRLGIDERVKKMELEYDANLEKAKSFDEKIHQAELSGDMRKAGFLKRDKDEFVQKINDQYELDQKHIFHMEPNFLGLNAYKAPSLRTQSNMPAMGKNLMSRQWEDSTDVAIAKTNKITPHNEKEYGTTRDFEPDALGFNHVVDVIREDLMAGRLRPEQLSKMNIDQAVARVANYNKEAEKAAMKAEGYSMANNLQLPDTKQYDNGFKWVKLPDANIGEKEHKAVRQIGTQGGWCTKDEHTSKLYSSAEDGKELFALLDSSGRPHIQIQVVTPPKFHTEGDLMQLDRNRLQRIDSSILDDYHDFFLKSGQRSPMYGKNFWSWFKEARPQQFEQMTRNTFGKEITEIKPFQNSWASNKVKAFEARNPNYRKELTPMIQDFVKSEDWSHVNTNDLRNSGMYLVDPDSDLAKSMQAAGEQVPPYVTDKEMTDLQKQFKVGVFKSQGGAVHMSEGGVVNLDDIVAKALSRNTPVNLDDIVHQALTKRFAKGGAAYNAI